MLRWVRRIDMSTARIFSLPQERLTHRRSRPSEHVVLFYGDDQAMLRQLESYVGTGISRGGSAVVIATAGRARQSGASAEK